MPSRNELNARARAAGLDPANYANDSKLEQKVLYLEKNTTAITGVAGAQTLTASGVFSAGETITIGSVTYTMRAALTGAKASSTLTSDATAPSDGDTVTVDGITYTFVTNLTNTTGRPYEVLIGASAAEALDNIKSAVNASAGSGTTYGAGTVAHPTVTAEANANTTQEFTAKRFGVYANNFVTTERSTHLAWDDTTLGGASATPGVDTIPNEVLIGADAATSLDNLKVAINAGATEGTNYSYGTVAHPEVNATTNTDTTQVVEANNFNVTNASIATTETCANSAWGAATLASGTAKIVAVAGASTKDTNAGIAGDENI